MKSTTSDFVAIDADLFSKVVSQKQSSLCKSKHWSCQCRWGTNENYSALTQFQALNLDFHFLVEQRQKATPIYL